MADTDNELQDQTPFNARVDRFNESLTDFEELVTSGQVDEQYIAQLNLTEPAKERLLATVQRLKPQEQQVTEQEPAVESPTFNVRVDQIDADGQYFQQEDGTPDDYFNFSPVLQAKSTSTANNLSTSANILAAGGLTAELQELIPSSAENLELFGEDPEVTRVAAELRSSYQQDLQTSVMRTVGTDQDPEGLIQATREELQFNELMSDEVHLQANAADLSSKYDVLFSQSLANIATNLETEALLSESADLNWSEGSFSDWLQVIGDGFVWSSVEKKFMADAMSAQGIDPKTASYILKTESLDQQLKFLDSGTPEERLQKVITMIDIVEKTPSLFGDNRVYSALYLQRIKDEFAAAGSGTSQAAVEDLLDLPVIGAVKTLFSAKILSGFAKRAGMTAEQQGAVREMIQRAQTQVQPINVVKAPNGKFVSLKRGKEGALADAMSAHNPDAVSEYLDAAMKSPDPVQAVTRLGLDEESAALRLMPSGAAEGNGIAVKPTTSSPYVSRLEQAASETGAGAVLTDEEKLMAVQRTVQEVAVQSGGRLQVHKMEGLSPAEVSDATREFSLTPVFGRTSTEGYDSLTDAEEAASWLFQGSDYRIKAKQRGVNEPLRDVTDVGEGAEFFVETDMKHVFTHADANPTPDAIKSYIPGLDYLVGWSTRLKESLYEGVNYAVDKSTFIAAEFRGLASKVNKLKGKGEGEQWSKLILHGDEYGMEFASKVDAEAYLGRMSDRVWDAYTSTRRAMNVMWDFRNYEQYKQLFSQGMRSLYKENGHIVDDAGKLFGRPVDALDASVPVVYDFRSGKPVLNTADTVAEVQGSGNVMVRLHRPARFGDQQYTHAILPRIGVNALDVNVMNKRVGHFDLNYADDPGVIGRLRGKRGGSNYVVAERLKVTRDGLPVEDSAVRAVFSTKAEADAWLAKQSNPEKYLAPAPSRELVRELGLDYNGTTSRVPAHARGRGEQLLQSTGGPAEVLGLEDTLAKVAGEVRSTFSKDVVSVNKTRFLKLAQKYAGADFAQEFPRSFSDLKLVKETPLEIRNELAAMFDWIQNLDRGIHGKVVSTFLQRMKMAGESMAGQSGLKSTIGTALKSMADSNVIQGLATLNTTMMITTRMLYQTVANSSQVWTLMAQSPALFFSKTLGHTTAVLGHLAGRNGPFKQQTSTAFGKVLGMTGEELNKFTDELLKSGVVSSRFGDDFLGMIEDSVTVQAGRNNPLTAQFYKSLPGKAISAATRVQSAAIDFANIVAYMHARNLHLQAGKSTTGLRNQQQILGLMRRLTFNQNRADQLAYQQNELSITFQFMQHVQRMYTEMIVKPTATLLTGPQGLTAKSPYSATRAQSAMTLAMVFSAFGFESILPQFLEDEINENMPDSLRTLFLDGYLGLAHDAVFGDAGNVAERFSPIDFVKTTMDFMFTDEGALNILGPSGHVLGSLEKFVRMAAYGTRHSSELDADYLVDFYQTAAIPLISGLNDLEKAKFVKNFGLYTTTSGRIVAEVDPALYRSVAASVAPEAAGKFFEHQALLGAGGKGGNRMMEIVGQVNKVYMHRLADVPSDQLTSDVLVDEWLKANQFLEVFYSDDPIMLQEAKGMLRNWMIDPEKEFLPKYAPELVKTIGIDAESALLEYGRIHPQDKETSDMLLGIIKDIKQSNEATNVR